MRQLDTSLLVDKTRPSTLPKKVIYILVRARTSPNIVRWAFLLFVFTIPFENLEATSGAASLARIAGLLFFSICLFYPKVCFRYPPQALWWFSGYIAIYGLSGLLIPERFVGSFISRLQTLIQLLVFCWIGSTLLQEEKCARHTLLTFSIAILLLATGIVLGLPGFSESWGEGRLSAAGLNPNGLATLMALAAQALIGFSIDQTRRNKWIRVTFLVVSLLPLMIMVYTGSRGGIIAFLTGVAVYVLPYRGSKRKMAAILVAAIACVSVIYAVVSDQSTMSRFERSYEKGDTAGRDRLFAVSVDMISEKPLLGWHPIVYSYELASREGWYGPHNAPHHFLQMPRDAHNLFFHLLVEVGLVGALPFLIGLGLCVWAAWTARVSSLGLLPLTWLITTIVANMSGTGIVDKLLWFVLALSLASGALPAKQHNKKNLMVKAILQRRAYG